MKKIIVVLLFIVALLVIILHFESNRISEYSFQPTDWGYDFGIDENRNQQNSTQEQEVKQKCIETSGNLSACVETTYSLNKQEYPSPLAVDIVIISDFKKIKFIL